jgi:glycosyltransferase involved in cell wall biosynthesis
MRTVLFDLTLLETETRVRGVGRYIMDLARGLGETGAIRARFLEHVGWIGDFRVTDDASAAIARLTAPNRPFTHHMSWAYRLRLGLARALRRSQADLLHLPHSFATPLFCNGVKRVVTCHDLIPLRFPKQYGSWKDGYSWGRRKLDLRRFGRADRIIAISETTAADLREILEVPAGKISVVYNAIDLASWSAAPHPADLEQLAVFGLAPRSYLLYAGDADWRKNHRGMFAALAIARRRVPDLRLVCAGTIDGSRLRRVLDEARRNGVSDAVVLTGHVGEETLRVLYRRAMATLFVSHAEGFGLPMVEAMASGSPLITSDCSSMAEIAEGAALLVPPSRADAIADAILALADNAALREELAAKGLERAKRFSLQRQVRDTEAVYLAT